MIDFLSGRIIAKSPMYITIDVCGIGYGLIISLNTFSNLPDVGDKVRLFTYLTLKDEKPQLFGFISENERELFTTLISISGIGPKIALRILSEIEPKSLTKIIQKGEVESISRIKGIGEKTAKRIILELSNRLVVGEGKDKGLIDSCKEALMSLGYSQKEAREACKRAGLLENIKTLDELIREALRQRTEHRHQNTG